MNKRVVFFILLHFILFGLFLNPEIGFTQAQDPVDPNVICLELIEENVDDFDSTLFRIRRRPEVMPFLFRNHTLQINDEILEYSEGEISLLQDLSNCHIHVIDMDGIMVYLKHIIRFNGNGRKYDFNEYYIFNQFPQVISLPLSEAPSTFYTLETSMLKVLEIRLSHGDIRITEVSDKGDITVEYNGAVMTIGSGQVHPLGERQETIRVINGSPLSTRIDYGEREFSTKLTLRNHGFPSKVEIKTLERR